MPHRITPLALVFCLLAANTIAFGQWSSDAAVNLLIDNGASEQTQSKIAATSDGGCYISWYDNATGGYDVYLQRLDSDGTATWPAGGVLIADRSFSSTQDYDLKVDANDNAIITYRDDRATGTQIGVNLVQPDGTLAWGAGGVLVTNTTAFVANPKVTPTSDGYYVVGWTQDTGIGIQRLDANGTPQWTAGGIIDAPATGSYSMSFLQPSLNGSVIALWVRPIGNFLSNKHLYTQRFDTTGAAVWNSGSPVIVFDANSVQNGYFPTFIPDGNGGAIYAWYETGGDRNCYVQHVNSGGTEEYAHNGLAGSIQAGRLAISADVSYDASNDDIYLFWAETNTNQNQWGLYGQRFRGGVALWGSSGLEVEALSSNQNSFVKTVFADGLARVFQFDRSGPSKVTGYGVKQDGSIGWGSTDVSSVLAGKSRLNVTIDECGNAMLTWGDQRSDASDVYAQNVDSFGNLGNPMYPLGDMNCDQALSTDDIVPFVTAVLDASAYSAAFPCCDPLNGDFDGDDALTGDDIQGFVSALLIP